MLTLISQIEPVLPLWNTILIVVVWVGVVFLLAEGMNHWKLAEPETTRKVVHIGIGNVILLAWWLQIPLWLGVTASILFSAIALLSYRIPILESVNGVGRKSLGTFFYALSFAILITCFWQQTPHFAVLGILVMTWGDGLAALIGQRWGRHVYSIWGMKKSWEGSLAMALASYMVASLIFWGVRGNTWQTWTIPLVVALVATVLEAFSRLGIDNLTAPLGSAAIAFFFDRMLFAPDVISRVMELGHIRLMG